MNFNDFASAIITLFTIMVINNWFNTTNMLCDVVGNKWPRLFTFSFIIIVVWIFLSVLIAFVLEIHGTVADEVEKEFKRRMWVDNLKHGWKKGGLNYSTRNLIDEELKKSTILDERMAQIGKEVYKQRAMSTDDLSPLNSFQRRNSSGIYDQDTSTPFGGGGLNNM